MPPPAAATRNDVDTVSEKRRPETDQNQVLFTFSFMQAWPFLLSSCALTRTAWEHEVLAKLLKWYNFKLDSLSNNCRFSDSFSYTFGQPAVLAQLRFILILPEVLNITQKSSAPPVYTQLQGHFT